MRKLLLTLARPAASGIRFWTCRRHLRSDRRFGQDSPSHFPTSLRLVVEQSSNLRRKLISGYDKRGVEMDIAMGHATRRMTEPAGDRRLGKPKVARDIGKGVPKKG